MGGFPLVALQLRPPPNATQMLTEGVQLRSLLQQQGIQKQNAGEVSQLNQQAIQEGGIKLQQQQQAMQDQQVVQAALKQLPPNGTLRDVLPLIQGKVSLATQLSLEKADAEHTKTLGEATELQFKNHISSQQQLQSIYNNVMSLPDDQFQQQWPVIADSVNNIPGHPLKLDPSKPISKQDLQGFSPALALNEGYLANEAAKRAKQAELAKTQAETKKLGAEADAAVGGKTDVDKYITNWLAARNLPNTPANWAKAHQAFTTETKTEPGLIRIEGLAATRQVQATDSKTGQETIVSMEDVKNNPGRYIPLPTSTNRTMQQMAASVRPQAAAIVDQVDAIADKLGPAIGRWKELWVNKVGREDPDFAKLDENLGLLSSAIVRTHFGAAGGQEYMAALRKDFGEAQSPENLKARIAAADSWLEGYAAMSKRQGQAGGAGTNKPQAKKTISLQAIQRAAKEHGISVDAAKKQAEAQGYQIP